MKIINKHIYADISEKQIVSPYTNTTDQHYQTMLAYKVNFITEYDIVLFGKTFHKTKNNEVPFLFKTLDMAKEFCEINPKYEQMYFQSNDSGGWKVKFYTYGVLLNGNLIGYIQWHNDFVIINYNELTMEFKVGNDAVAVGFVKNVSLKNWVDTNSIYDIKYYGFTDKLADLVKSINNDNEKHWRFELIEEK